MTSKTKYFDLWHLFIVLPGKFLEVNLQNSHKQIIENPRKGYTRGHKRVSNFDSSMCKGLQEEPRMITDLRLTYIP